MKPEQKLKKINLLSRYGLGFLFFYQGLVPKILWLDSTEILLVKAHGFLVNYQMISQIGGALEIVLSLWIIVNKKSLMPIYAAILILIFFLIDVAIIVPSLLITAFNPMTLNITGIILGLTAVVSHCEVLVEQKSESSQRQCSNASY